jgi:hypothetical protein
MDFRARIILRADAVTGFRIEPEQSRAGEIRWTNTFARLQIKDLRPLAPDIRWADAIASHLIEDEWVVAVVVFADTLAVIENLVAGTFPHAGAFTGDRVRFLTRAADDRVRAVTPTGFGIQYGIAGTIVVGANAGARAVVVNQSRVGAFVEVTEGAVTDAAIGIGSEIRRAVDRADAGALIFGENLSRRAIGRNASGSLILTFPGLGRRIA